jgi:hypothetical protein
MAERRHEQRLVSCGEVLHPLESELVQPLPPFETNPGQHVGREGPDTLAPPSSIQLDHTGRRGQPGCESRLQRVVADPDRARQARRREQAPLDDRCDRPGIVVGERDEGRFAPAITRPASRHRTQDRRHLSSGGTAGDAVERQDDDTGAPCRGERHTVPEPESQRFGGAAHDRAAPVRSGRCHDHRVAAELGAAA